MDAPLTRALDVPEPQVHGLCVTAPLSPSHPGPVERAGRAKGLWQQAGRQYWHGRVVNVQVHGGGPRKKPRVAVYLDADSKPLSVPEFAFEYVPYVSGLLAGFGVDPESPQVRVREIDIHADYPRPKLGLRGWETETLYGFRGGLLKVYNKRKIGATRIEACLWPVDLTPAEAVRILGELTRPLPADERPYKPGPADPNAPEVG